MTDRENLIALVKGAFHKCLSVTCKECEEYDKDAEASDRTCQYRLFADHLIANGVTFATDNHVGGKWIPVTERLPEDGQTVIACVTHRFGDKSIIPMVFWHESYFHWQDVTHWMPLPEPPKEGE